jgi:hypothetical protein
MSLGWKILLPLATVNALVTASPSWWWTTLMSPYDPGPDVVEVVRAPSPAAPAARTARSARRCAA